MRFNKEHIFVVNKEKLIEKSHYFKSITKSCFADHKSEFVEVNIPASFELFKQVIDYLVTDHIDIDANDVFELLKVSDYLDIECLSSLCFNCFIFNLYLKTLDHQLSIIEKQPMSYKTFIKAALKFKSTTVPSIKGLYLFLSFKFCSFLMYITDNRFDQTKVQQIQIRKFFK